MAATKNECIICSEHCPLDQSLDNSLPCHCTQNCTTADTCNKTHHPLYDGTVKRVIYGICAPAVLQPFLKHALANMPPNIKIITLIANSTLQAETMRGEIESMKAVDAADPKGVFTSKLIYQQIVFARNTEERECSHVGVRRILKKLSTEDDTLPPSIAQKCICVNGKRNTTCPRCKYLALRKNLESWQKRATDLHYIYMEYTGETLATLPSESTPSPSFYRACQNLLRNYNTLYDHQICHLDLHAANLTWNRDTSGNLAFKFIDFGFNRVYDQREKLCDKCPDCAAVDVTKLFMRICRVTKNPLRPWHPVEYPMFHACVTLLLSPLLVPDTVWNLKNHVAKVKQITLLDLATVPERDMVDLGSVDDATTAFLARCPLRHAVYGTPCARAALQHEAYNLLKKIPQTYCNIRQHLPLIWGRVCAIVGAEISRVHFAPDGRGQGIHLPDPVLCEGGEALTHTSEYSKIFDVFRTQFYFCQELDLRTVEREFDTFSLAAMILYKISPQDVHLRAIVHSQLMCCTSFEKNRTKLSDAVADIELRLQSMSCT